MRVLCRGCVRRNGVRECGIVEVVLQRLRLRIGVCWMVVLLLLLLLSTLKRVLVELVVVYLDGQVRLYHWYSEVEFEEVEWGPWLQLQLQSSSL